MGLTLYQKKKSCCLILVDVWEVRDYVVDSFPCFSLQSVSGVGYLQAGKQRGSLGDPSLLESRMRPGRRSPTSGCEKKQNREHGFQRLQRCPGELQEMVASQGLTVYSTLSSAP